MANPQQLNYNRCMDRHITPTKKLRRTRCMTNMLATWPDPPRTTAGNPRKKRLFLVDHGGGNVTHEPWWYMSKAEICKRLVHKYKCKNFDALREKEANNTHYLLVNREKRRKSRRKGPPEKELALSQSFSGPFHESQSLSQLSGRALSSAKKRRIVDAKYC